MHSIQRSVHSLVSDAEERRCIPASSAGRVLVAGQLGRGSTVAISVC